MKRITPDQVVEAYRTKGLAPRPYTTGMKRSDGTVMCCALGAFRGPVLSSDDVWGFFKSLDDEFGSEYITGFMLGFDDSFGNNGDLSAFFKDCPEEALGYEDGTAAGQAVRQAAKDGIIKEEWEM